LRALPDTTTGKAPDSSFGGPVLAAAWLGAVLLAAVVSVWPAGFSPGERLISPGAKDIAVSRQDTSYPSSDTLRFEERTMVVYVYLRLEDLPADGDFEARVVRTARASVVRRLFGDRGIRLVEETEKPLGASGGRVSGVVKFAVRPLSAKPLPTGNYTVEVYTARGGPEPAGPLARKYFVVGR
jgi:hypothetical protein